MQPKTKVNTTQQCNIPVAQPAATPFKAPVYFSRSTISSPRLQTYSNVTIPPKSERGSNAEGISLLMFETDRLPLAIYLDASGVMRFSHCESIGNGKVKFVFQDPQNVGADEERKFDRGECVSNVQSIFASQRFLRRKTQEVLNTVR